LSSSQLFGLDVESAAKRQRDVDERRKEGRVLRRIEADLP
jgi:hypothetical protein